MIGKKIAFGRTAEIYEWGKDKILKLYFDRIPIEIIKYEYLISEKAHHHFADTPRVYDKLIINGRTGIIFEKMIGHTILEEVMQKPLKTNVAKEIALLQVKMHNCPVNSLKKQKDDFRKQITRVTALDHHTKEKILKHLDALKEDNKLCHGDFHYDNLYRTNNNRILVFDWMNAMQGNPAADVARTFYILSHGAPISKLKLLHRIMLTLFQKIHSHRYLRSYLKNSDIKRKEIVDWEIIILAIRFTENIDSEKKYLLKRIQKIARRI